MTLEEIMRLGFRASLLVPVIIAACGNVHNDAPSMRPLVRSTWSAASRRSPTRCCIATSSMAIRPAWRRPGASTDLSFHPRSISRINDAPMEEL